MKIKAATAGILLPVLIIAGVLLTTATGYWETESSKEPVKFETGNFAGEYNPADIRGSYSFSDLEKVFDIPVETLAKAFGLSDHDNPGVVQIKIFEEVYPQIEGMEIGTDSMRLFVSLYKGLPYTPEETTALPEPAWNILKKEGAVGTEELAGHEFRKVSLAGLDVHGVESAEAGEEHSEEEAAAEIKGKTLFSELLDWGLEKEQIEEILGMPMGPASVAVRDFCIEHEIEFSTVKVPLQELLDKAGN